MSIEAGDAHEDDALEEGALDAEAEAFRSAGVLAVRRGPGANCSSIGSAVEMLFLSAAAGAIVLGAIAGALRPKPAGAGAKLEKEPAEPEARDASPDQDDEA